MKKGSAVFICVLSLLTMGLLSACSHDPAPTDPPQTTEATTTQTEPVEVTYAPDDVRTHMPEFGGYAYAAEVTKEGTNKTEALALTREILTHPGELYILGDGYSNPIQLLLDVNNDGTPERVAISCSGEKGYTYSFTEEDGQPYVCWEDITLAVGNGQTEMPMSRDEKYLWRIVAVSLEGEEILLGIQSEDETVLFRCDGAEVSRVFGGLNLMADGIYISEGEILYDCPENWYFQLNAAVKVYAEPNADSEVTVLESQKVQFVQEDLGHVLRQSDMRVNTSPLSGRFYWVYFRAEDGTEGWFKLQNQMETADGGTEQFITLFTAVE